MNNIHTCPSMKNEVEVLVCLECNGKEELRINEVLKIRKNSSLFELATRIYATFRPQIDAKGRFVSVKKYWKKFDHYVVVKPTDENFLEDGTTFLACVTTLEQSRCFRVSELATAMEHEKPANKSLSPTSASRKASPPQMLPAKRLNASKSPSSHLRLSTSVSSSSHLRPIPSLLSLKFDAMPGFKKSSSVSRGKNFSSSNRQANKSRKVRKKTFSQSSHQASQKFLLRQLPIPMRSPKNCDYTDFQYKSICSGVSHCSDVIGSPNIKQVELLGEQDLVESGLFESPSMEQNGDANAAPKSSPLLTKNPIQDLLWRCRFARSPLAKVEMIAQIFAMYQADEEDIATMINSSFEEKMLLEHKDPALANYDFDFAENFQDFWSYGLLIWGEETAWWSLDTESRCLRSLRKIAAHCPVEDDQFSNIFIEVENCGGGALTEIVCDTKAGSAKIISCNGEYNIAFHGTLIRLVGGISEAVTFFVRIHSFFAVRFSNSYKDLLYVITLLMGLPLPCSYRLSAAQEKMIKGSFEAILEKILPEDGRHKESFSWSPKLMDNCVSDGIVSIYK